MAFSQKILEKLRARNRMEVIPFQDMVESIHKLHILSSEREQLDMANARLKEENELLRHKSLEADHQQVSVLEKKLFGVQEELTELHRRRGENAQQIIDQAVQIKEHEKQAIELQSKLDAALSRVQQLSLIHI